MRFPSIPSLPSLPSPGDVIDAAGDVVDTAVDGAEAVGGVVVDGLETVGGVALDGLEVLGGAAMSAFNAVAGLVGDAYDCIASNFDELHGTLVAVVDGAKIKCDQCPGPGLLTAASATTPLLEGKRAATITDHVVGRNVFPFPGTCKKTSQPCVIAPVGDWIPAAKGTDSGAPLLPSNALLVCSVGGFISITDPGQTSLKVTMAGVPLAPPGVDLEANRQLALAMRDRPLLEKLWWFYNHVKNGGPWDYKQRGRQYADFGNYHYGAIGAALDIPTPMLRRAAGLAQQQADTSQPDYGSPTDVCGTSSFGDDPRDQEMIGAGIDHHP